MHYHLQSQSNVPPPPPPPSTFMIIVLWVFLLSTEPSLSVTVEPTTILVLDVAPYNVFTITCTGALSNNISATKTFNWRRQSAGSETPVTHNGVTTIIQNSDLADAISTSVLTAREYSAGTVTYTCESSVLEETDLDTATVVVKGKKISKMLSKSSIFD